MGTWIIQEGKVGLLFEDGVLRAPLPPGRHTFSRWPWSPQREVIRVDVRERSATIKNQEILTADKVAVRISLIVYFKVVDPVAAVREVDAFEDRIYEDVQLAARRFLATRTLDQILRDRNELSDAIRQDVRASAQSFGVEVRRADVKDIVFPGNLREIMNRVIETERESEARLIHAQKNAEVIRLESESYAQAAKAKLEIDEKAAELIARAPGMARLKELEVLKEIGQRGGNTFYVGVERLSRPDKP